MQIKEIIVEYVERGITKIGNTVFDIRDHAMDRLEERHIPPSTAREMLRRIDQVKDTLEKKFPPGQQFWAFDENLDISLGLVFRDNGNIAWTTSLLGFPRHQPGMGRYPDINISQLTEAFDQPYPLTWERGEFGMDAFTKLPDGTQLEINFNDEYDGDGSEITHVEFHRGHSQSVTGEGDAQKIFATVLAAIQQFIKDERPKRITFAADKEPGPSRANLYTRLVDRFARPMGYQVDTYEAGTSLYFDLIRRWGLR